VYWETHIVGVVDWSRSVDFVDMGRRLQLDADKGPEVVGFTTAFNFLAVHFGEILLGEESRHISEHLLLSALPGNDHTSVELGRDSEAHHSVDVGTDHLQVHQSNEQVRHVVFSDLVEGGLLVLDLFLEQLAFLVVSDPLVLVVGELLDGVTLSTGSLGDVVSLGLVNHNAEKLVLVFVFETEVCHGMGHDRAGHAALLLFL